MKTKFNELLSNSIRRIKIEYSTKEDAENAAQRLYDKYADNGGHLYLQEISLIMTVGDLLEGCGWNSLDDMYIDKSKVGKKYILYMPKDLVLLDFKEDKK